MNPIEDTLADEIAKSIAEEIDREIIETMLWETTLKECQGWYKVELAWEKETDSEYLWNEACAWALENFGLPGENYVTHPNKRNMLFLFKNEKDAIMMTLKWI